LVVVFLRGGADGLHLVPPVHDDAYRRSRPLSGVAPAEAHMLDDRFGLHPDLGPLAAAYGEGGLLVVHGTGSEDESRSHFEAQDLMENGGDAAGGWLGRFLRYKAAPADGPLAALALGARMPEMLRGAPAVVVAESLAELQPLPAMLGLSEALLPLYDAEPGDLAQAGHDTHEALLRIRELDLDAYAPANGAVYPEDRFGASLRQTAQVLKAGLAVEAVCIDVDGWDAHAALTTFMANPMRRLAGGLAAFHADLAARMASVTVVVMSEFGRRIYENASAGTDHGRGGVMLLMGGGVRGGRVLCGWDDLDSERVGPGDVPVTTNYRNVLAPILARHGGSATMERVFPRFAVEPVELYA
jgi:uncharacterized protein (DUF1501 family)